MPDLVLRDVDPSELRKAITADVIAALQPLLIESKEPRLVDGDRMAELAAVSRPTIERKVREGVIPSVLVGSCRRYDPRAVIDALAEATRISSRERSTCL